MNTSFAAQRRKLLIALEASALSVVLLFMSACGSAKTPTPPPAPNPLIFSLDAILISCAATAPNVSPAVAGWLVPGCATAVNGVLTTVTAPGTAAQIQAAFTALQAFVSAAPTGALSQQDQQIIASITGAVNAFLTIYRQQYQPSSLRIANCDETMQIGRGPPVSVCAFVAADMSISDAPRTR